MRILWFDILFILYFTYISSSENKELQSLVDNGKIEKADSLYKELLKIEAFFE